MAKLIDGKKFAENLCKKISEEVKKLKNKNITPGLAVIRVGEDPASTVYINMKAKKTEEVGMHSVTKILDENTSQDNLLKVVDILGREVNPNKVIDNITLFYIYSDGSVERRIVFE